MKTFKYKNNKKCYFIVSSYQTNPNAIAFSIENLKQGLITTCTVYIANKSYTKGLATIKNYSENSGMTEFLKKLGIVTKVFIKKPCNDFVIGTFDPENAESIDTVLIDTDKLKEYSKEWYYDAQ